MVPAIQETVDFIRAQCRMQPVLGLILGSGLGAYADSFRDRTAVPFTRLPHFPIPSVPGHPGNLVFGIASGIRVVAMQGRLHLYEGLSMAEVAFPARVLCSLGITRLVVTNAAGGIAPSLHPGDLMLIADHINLMGANPLAGPNPDELGPRFPDMSEAYDAGMRRDALEAARRKGIGLREGVYAGVPGPSYETPAEVRMLRTLGADAVGMSTVPEAIVANHMGVRVLGLSCIANMAAGILPGRLTHEGVLATARRGGETLQALLGEILPRIG